MRPRSGRFNTVAVSHQAPLGRVGPNATETEALRAEMGEHGIDEPRAERHAVPKLGKSDSPHSEEMRAAVRALDVQCGERIAEDYRSERVTRTRARPGEPDREPVEWFGQRRVADARDDDKRRALRTKRSESGGRVHQLIPPDVGIIARALRPRLSAARRSERHAETADAQLDDRVNAH